MEFKGIVGRGKGEGTKNGFPSANIVLADASLSGIYAGIVVVEGKEYQAAVYADQSRGLLESHLLDFSGDLYGKEIEVSLKKKLRDPIVFSSVKSLQKTIAEDITTTRLYFKGV
ncbi:MAG: riboflavin kinase [Minisyncoccia bacterium]